MRFFSLFSHFLDDLRKQRLRTTLTILGITWGTVAVVVLLAFGVGVERQTRRNASGMGEGIMILFGGRTTQPFDGFAAGRPIRMREHDAALLASEVTGIRRISPEYGGRNTPARRGTRLANPYITGVVPIYAEMRNIVIEPGGRFLNPLDMAQRRRVVVLGDEIRNQLFAPDEQAIGEYVYVGDVPFIVVGIMQPKTQNSSYSARDQDRIFIPASTYAALFDSNFLNNIVIQPADPELAPAIKDGVYRTFGRKYRFDPDDRSAIGIWDTNEMQKFFKYFFLGFNLFLGIVGSFTLAVGGIGVANIMYIVVRERTREIGIRRSIGARRRDIMLQFIAETFFIVGIGALLGLGLSMILAWLGGMLPIEEFVGKPTISPMVVSATLGLLTGIAFFAGLFPARKAASLDPVECLRY